jgi:serine/threonine-protein kinase
LPQGTRIGNWVIQQRLGKGGMGVVYLARHHDLDTPVAIKYLSPVLSKDPGFRTRFDNEARTQAQLRHPNIAHLQDYGEQDGTIYIHRDVTSSNVMLDHFGVAKVMDFGIAIVEGGKRVTTAGVALGTPQYMSPEQIRRPGEVDHRTDIYSMGIVLYELLTGRVPFDANSDFEIKHAQVSDPPPPPRSVNPAIPEELERIVLKALEKEPKQRYMGCAEFSRALEDFAHKLRPPTVTLTSPKIGDAWQIGSYQTITWTASATLGGPLAAIEIEVSKEQDLLAERQLVEEVAARCNPPQFSPS